MANASKEVLARLEAIVNQGAKGLGKVAPKKMFGCHGLFANDNIFALVWKEGRIAVRLPDVAEFGSLMGLSGSAPWKAGKMTMSHWIMVPAPMHDAAESLKKWLAKAHALAVSQPKAAKKTKPSKTTAAKKTTKPAGKVKAPASAKKQTTANAKSKAPSSRKK